eukprot:CAMPEP_0182460334 /NCGR_PEP_ID=MMETSP1319-20130603/5231_1 /TAXON_ID=172717 /ORGANISM="Bolidomonas pacifica, Strain RCC208" /LENGTH=299 /DNA_ID=CAMNT_0024659417 /DNA_START=104 /DNA_END=1000 /DNA_ORIENTATION=+
MSWFTSPFFLTALSLSLSLSLSSVSLAAEPPPTVLPHPEVLTISVQLDARDEVLSAPFPPQDSSPNFVPVCRRWCEAHVDTESLDACVSGISDLFTREYENYLIPASTVPFAPSKKRSPKARLYVIDDFLSDPDALRSLALSLEYEVETIPGTVQRFTRSPQLSADPRLRLLKPAVEEILGARTLNWSLNGGDNIRIQLTFSDEYPTHCVHTDNFQWAGLLYLHPSPPPNTGTTFYRHKASSSLKEGGSFDWTSDKFDMDAWEAVDTVGNVYNRLILFDASHYHRSEGYFGGDKEGGRM